MPEVYTVVYALTICHADVQGYPEKDFNYKDDLKLFKYDIPKIKLNLLPLI